MTQQLNSAQIRILQVQQLLIKANKPLKLVDVANHIGKPEATALRDLRTLASEGWVTQTPEGSWRIGATWYELKRTALNEIKGDLHKLIDNIGAT